MGIDCNGVPSLQVEYIRRTNLMQARRFVRTLCAAIFDGMPANYTALPSLSQAEQAETKDPQGTVRILLRGKDLESLAKIGVTVGDPTCRIDQNNRPFL